MRINLIIGLLLVVLSGCAAVPYIGGGASAVHNQMKFVALEERVKALEDGDIW